MKGKNTWSKGRKFIHKDGIMKAVTLNEIQKYIDDGWEIGRIRKKF
jgi:hypothetical protein